MPDLRNHGDRRNYGDLERRSELSVRKERETSSPRWRGSTLFGRQRIFSGSLKMGPEAPADAFCDNVGGLCEGYSKRAYVTFLAGDGDYVKGVVGLVKGLRKVKSAYPLIVAGLPDVPDQHRRLLSSRGCIVHEIQPIYPPENHIQFAMAYYVINYSKLWIWEGSKPWSYTGKEENMQREDIKMLVNKWLEIYNDLNLDFKWTYVVAKAQITIFGLQQVTENSLLAALPRMYPAFTSVPPAA